MTEKTVPLSQVADKNVEIRYGMKIRFKFRQNQSELGKKLTKTLITT